MNIDYHTRQDFPDADSLAVALAERIAADLNRALSKQGHAVLALSGGSSPKRFFKLLPGCDVDWSKVTLTLVDERWVPATHERSNEKLVRDFLMTGPAARAGFIGLHCDAETPEAGLENITQNLPDKIDVAVLGLGPDGHTASFFPGGDKLQDAINPDNPASVISMRAKGAGEPRITLTLSKLLKADKIYLHIEGQEKSDVLANAFEDGPVDDAPIRALIRQNKRPLEIFWAP
jgi:6-phosphogluconolactonase